MLATQDHGSDDALQNLAISLDVVDPLFVKPATDCTSWILAMPHERVSKLKSLCVVHHAIMTICLFEELLQIFERSNNECVFVVLVRCKKGTRKAICSLLYETVYYLMVLQEPFYGFYTPN